MVNKSKELKILIQKIALSLIVFNLIGLNNLNSDIISIIHF